MGKNKKIILNTAVLYIRSIITLLLSLVSTRYILLALGESDFGLYNVIAGVVLLFSFISSSMSAASQRYISYEIGRSKDIAKVRHVFECCMSMHLCVAVIAFLVVLIGGSIFIACVLNIPVDRVHDAYIVLLTVALGLAATIITVPFESVLMARENITMVAIAQLLIAFSRFFIALFIINLEGNHLLQFSIATACIQYIVLLMEYVYCHRTYKETRAKQVKFGIIDKELSKQMGSFMSFSLFGAIGWTVRTQGFSVILNIFWGVAINAANGIATQVSSAITNFTSSLTVSIRPQLIQSVASNDLKRTGQLLEWSCKFPTCLVLFFSIPIYVMLPYIFKIWLHDVPDYTLVFCRSLIVALIINQSTWGLAIYMDARGKIARLHTVVSCSLIICTVVAYITALCGGSPQLVYTLLIINNLFIATFRLAIVSKERIIQTTIFLLRCLVRPLLIAGITFLTIWYVWNALEPNFVNLIITGVISSIEFIMGAWLVVLTKEEKLKLKILILNKINRS